MRLSYLKIPPTHTHTYTHPSVVQCTAASPLLLRFFQGASSISSDAALYSHCSNAASGCCLVTRFRPLTAKQIDQIGWMQLPSPTLIVGFRAQLAHLSHKLTGETKCAVSRFRSLSPNVYVLPSICFSSLSLSLSNSALVIARSEKTLSLSCRERLQIVSRKVTKAIAHHPLEMISNLYPGWKNDPECDIFRCGTLCIGAFLSLFSPGIQCRRSMIILGHWNEPMF